MIDFLFRAIPVVAVLILVGVLIMLVVNGFASDNGARSLSAGVLPVLVLTLTYFLNDQQPLPILNLPTFPLVTLATIAGFITALLVHRVPSGNIPLAELVVSALMTWIASSWLITEDNGNAFVFSTSGLIGAAIYFVFFGRNK